MPSKFIIKLLQGEHRPLYLSRDYPDVTWLGKPELAKAYGTKRDAEAVVKTLPGYGDITVEER